MNNASNWTQSVVLATEDKGAYCHSNQDERFLMVLSKSIALFLIFLTSNKENATKNSIKMRNYVMRQLSCETVRTRVYEVLIKKREPALVYLRKEHVITVYA